MIIFNEMAKRVAVSETNSNKFFVEACIKTIHNLKKSIVGFSKVNEINFMDKNIVVFQIEDGDEIKGNGDTPLYITLDDVVLLTFEQLKKISNCDQEIIFKYFATNCQTIKMSKIDRTFENGNLIILKLCQLNQTFFEGLVSYLFKIQSCQKQEKSSLTLDFNNDIYSNSIVNSDESEGLMFSQLDVSDGHKKYEKNYTYQVPQNDSFTSLNSFENPEVNKKTMLLCPDRREWYADPLDSLICGDNLNERFENTQSTPLKIKENLIYDDYIKNSNFQSKKYIQHKNAGVSCSNGARPFVCHFRCCNRAFKRFEHLKRHYRIHTGERPFKCKFPGCQKSFARSDNLNQHLKVHNGGMGNFSGNNGRQYKYLEEN
ncbi:hypothetical protein EDEG_00517 [Edhazardia aedis USNM 41457]|uniref:C2H2-type domain-containing protein n=1 Tax=Edhazardia aedis (strain USNM 41457) TaxID=1003232 RepID=J9DFB9_EDHAE|nr:hypothetical protein EDEG_00517 [Edhazardia aedis USNM 41457]|eukprot:EJW01300.1 hypothetical protein EDEG_00517 [Edhazardia aedis USNM 41457]